MKLVHQIRNRIAPRHSDAVWEAPHLDEPPLRAAPPTSRPHEHPEEMWVELAGPPTTALAAARALRAHPNVTRVGIRRAGRWLVVTGCELAFDDVAQRLDPLGIGVRSWFLFNVGGYDERPRGAGGE